jgi:hypothetical protein
MSSDLAFVIEFDYKCRPDEIALTIDDIERIQLAFPERRV